MQLKGRYVSLPLLTGLATGLLLSLLACGLIGESSPTTVPTPSATPTLTPTSLPTHPSTVSPQVESTPASTPVYLNESYNGRVFESADAWREKVREWEGRRPESPGLFDRLRGGRVGLRVSGELNGDAEIRNDKWKHCVVSSEIALATNLRTAEYVAWSKEHQGLTDSRPNTAFEEEDYEATVDGARQAAEEQVCEEYRTLCEERWGDRRKPWDGTKPPADGN